MIIVSNTTPLRYMIEIGKADILENLFEAIIIPQAVFDELQQEKTPIKVKEWIINHPTWLKIQPANITVFTPIKRIGSGEREAIAIAIELKANALLMDDRGAIIEAQRNNLKYISTFNILEQASARDLIDLRSVVDDIRKTTFRLPPEDAIEEMFERDIKRKIVN